MLKNIALIAPLGLVGVTILSGVFLMSSYSYATSDNTDIVDEINITVPISCTMSGTGMTSHTANMSNGSYTPNIGTTTLKVFCNDTEGFAIFAAGYTGDEIGGTNSTKLVNSASAVDNTISTGTATSGNTSNWAMKLATNSSATYAVTLDNGFGSYSSVPSSYTKVAHRDSGTDIGTTATGAELTTTYAAFVNQTQPAGTYVGKVIYTLVHPASEEPLQPQPATAGCINYFANASTAVGEMGCQSASNNASVTLWAGNFKRDGYGFAGWSDKYDYATNPNANFYGPNQDITAPSDVSTKGLSLYAVWIPSAGTIQNWDGCSSLAQGATTALTDERDSNTYAIAKLADNKCWMIENLRLDNIPELSSTNTHNPSLPLTNVYGSTTSNHLSPTTNPTTTAWCSSASSACNDQSMLTTNNTVLFTNNTSSSYNESSNVYSYGNYYNWYSATAGHGKYSSSNDPDYIVSGDICPAGWRLSTGGSASSDFRVLDVSMGGTGGYQSTAVASNRWRTYPNNYVYSGHVEGSSVTGRSSSGSYWSSTGSSNNVSIMIFDKSSIIPSGSGETKSYGMTVRCIAGV